MKRLLILSYHAMPMDVVSSYRTKAFCDHLQSFGIYPTLLTHRWELDNEKKWKFHRKTDGEIVESNECFSVIRLPRLKAAVPKKNVLKTFLNYFKGDFELELKASYITFRQFLLKHLVENKYDAILTIYSPHFQMKIANEVKRKFGIPYITDFRDLWDNQIVTKDYKPTIQKKVIDFAIGCWWKKWIKDSLFFSVAGEQWRRYLEDLSSVEGGIVVRNGFDSKIEHVEIHPITNDEFVIAHFGKLYPNQNLDIFILGFQLFLAGRPDAKVKLVIIGHKPKFGINIEDLLSVLPPASWEVMPYLGREELHSYCKKYASVFWMPGFHRDNGSFAVKVFDYMVLGKNIIFSPGDGSEIESVILKTQTGIVCNSIEEVRDQLSSWYEVFLKTRSVPYHGDKDSINMYARVDQVKLFADKFHGCIH